MANVLATNNVGIDFEMVINPEEVQVTHWGLWTRMAGGEFIYGGEIEPEKRVLLQSGNKLSFLRRDFQIGIVLEDDLLSLEGAVRLLKGLLGADRGQVFLSLHDGDPDRNGYNEIKTNNIRRQRVTLRMWDIDELVHPSFLPLFTSMATITIGTR